MTPTTEELAALCERLLATGDDMECVIEAVDALEALGAELAQMKADPLHTMLMQQSTHRLGEIHKLEAKLSDLRAKLATAVEALDAVNRCGECAQCQAVTDSALALIRLEGPDPLDPVDSPQPPLV